MMENEIGKTVPVSYTKCLWAFACLGGAVPFWLATLLTAWPQRRSDNLLLELFLSGFNVSLLVFPAAWATAFWAKRCNWRRNLAGCLKTICAGGVCGGAYVAFFLFLAMLNALDKPSYGEPLWFELWLIGVFAVCGMVSAAVLSVWFLPKPDK